MSSQPPPYCQLETLFVVVFLEAHRRPPTQIILDLDATGDPPQLAERSGHWSVASIRSALN